MKRLICALLLLSILLSGCGAKQPERKQYTATFLDVFDTVTSITGKADSEAAFRETTQAIYDELLEYHQLFDIYNDYEGIHNLKTVNDNAGIAPVKVDQRILALLQDCKTYYELSGGLVNPAMGSVLQLWHVARNDGINDPANAYLPQEEALLQAAQRNYESGMVEYAERSIANYLQQMNADFPFTLLIGLELANIGGCSLPTEGDEPFLYIGIDRALSRQWLDIFAPHELLHLVRNRRTKPACPETVLSRAVEEGLASYASLWVHNLPWNAANVARTLNVSEAQAQNLLRSTDMLLQRLRSDGGKPISSETMQAYFTDFMPETELPVIGYYLGLHLTHEAVAHGADFSQLIGLPAEELAAAWL